MPRGPSERPIGFTVFLDILGGWGANGLWVCSGHVLEGGFNFGTL